ncbi:hypothetical protein ZIOFF_048876 [Zingiber officinale]|uniref:Oxidoreductase FAD/NAD(P)-binding domain-containing protein n=1 Tax=Zingiber officinale TaxID=94328 RepID=A0A8J5FQD1_ZINOF|nr:hypothetical protein ZIOFF_048876 [Zingiber officinale]
MVVGAGGTGITLMYQLTQAILHSPEDLTEMHLVYVNRSEDDILQQEELEGRVHRRLEQFKMEGEGNVSHAKKEKEKTNDPVKLRMKVEKLDAKIDALKAKKEEIIKQLYDLEGAGS